MIEFIAGLLIGAVSTISLAAYLVARNNSKPTAATLRDNSKLGIARRALGQIANRDSIGEARKIANVTLGKIK